MPPAVESARPRDRWVDPLHRAGGAKHPFVPPLIFLRLPPAPAILTDSRPVYARKSPSQSNEDPHEEEPAQDGVKFEHVADAKRPVLAGACNVQHRVGANKVLRAVPSAESAAAIEVSS